MAKGRHPAALFEVLHKPNFPDPPRRGIFGRTGGWFARRKAIIASTRLGSSESRSSTIERDEPVASERSASAPVSLVIPTPAARQAPVAPRITPMTAAPVAVAPTELLEPRHSYESSPSSSAAARAEGISLALDRRRQEILVRLSYISASIVIAGTIILLGLSYLFGKQATVSPRPVISRETTNDLRRRPPTPGVLTIARPTAPSVTPVPDPHGPASAAVRPPTPVPQATSTVVDDPRRQAGLNYVVVQSYAEEARAIRARDILIKEGITCTIEKSLRNLGSSRFQVVGTKGFSRISGPEYERYVKQIETISNTYEKKGTYQAFQPLAYKWGQ